MKRALAFLLVMIIVLPMCACVANKLPDNSLPQQIPSHTDPTKQTEPTEPTVGSEPTLPTGPSSCEHEMQTVHQQNATCTQPGSITSACTLCGQELTAEIPALGHSFADATCTKAKTCTACGVIEGDAMGHQYVSGKCERCGDRLPDEPSVGCTHEYQVSGQKAPTCTASGSITYKCGRCGHEYKDTLAANGHNYLDATCEAPQTCSVCSDTVGKALGHSYRNYICTRCGAVSPNKPSMFSVTVRTDKGKTVAGVTVTVYVDGSDTPAGSAVTGSNGKASIETGVADNFRFVLSDIPAGLEGKDSYSCTSMSANITLKTVPVRDPLDHSNAQYKVGDTMVDFTLTDIDGKDYQLYQLLAEKKVVILNFWYCACNPCKNEFPYFNSFYEAYGDKAEILALSPFDSDDSIRQVQQQLGLLFPVMRDTLGLNKGFDVKSYPVTVVITSDGVIRTIKENGFTSEQQLYDAVKRYL